jgi:hypothetical protein
MIRIIRDSVYLKKGMQLLEMKGKNEDLDFKAAREKRLPIKYFQVITSPRMIKISKFVLMR